MTLAKCGCLCCVKYDRYRELTRSNLAETEWKKDNVKLRSLLEKFTVEKINGHDFDKLLRQTKEGIISLGGWQNAYALQAIMTARDEAKATLNGGTDS